MVLHCSDAAGLIAEFNTNTVDVDVDVVPVVVSHPLHVLSHAPGAIKVPHKPFEAIPWHVKSSSAFVLLLQRSEV